MKNEGTYHGAEHVDTRLTTAGLAPECMGGVVNMPVTRASTILFKDLAEFEAVERGEFQSPTYGRYGTPVQTALEGALAALEGADRAIVFSSGLAAIICGLMAFTRAGDHILIPDTVYGPVRRFCDHELKRFGVETTYYDPLAGADIAALMRENTRLVYVESPGSLTFEVQDIPAIAAAAKARGIPVMADNTWATPLGMKPFELGVDISMHSATKYISGHSDLVMGVLSCKEAHYKKLLQTSKNLGACQSADNCYLALRGLRTLSVRMERHRVSTLKIAAWLQARPEVETVFYPALPGAPGHELWKRDFHAACGLFSVALKPVEHERLRAFVDGLEHFGMGYSWGGFESLLAPVNLDKIRTATRFAQEGPLLRLHIGLEHPDDLLADLERGFARMAA